MGAWVGPVVDPEMSKRGRKRWRLKQYASGAKVFGLGSPRS